MKNIYLKILFFTLILCLIAIQADSLDYPHNEINNIECESCHYVYGEDPSLLILGLEYGQNGIDDTEQNALCWSCHDDVVAPFVGTHSSLEIDNSYGDWTIECGTCHNPHEQKQLSKYSSESYITSGASTAITETTLTQADAGWQVDEYMGLLLIPKVTSAITRSYSYRITGNTSDTITVQGPIDLTKVAVGNTFAVIYGKLINSTIVLDMIIAPGQSITGNKTVRFFDSTGTNSFADGDEIYDGICEVCHTQTIHFRNDGTGSDQNHLNMGAVAGTNCTTCHSHLNGFAPTSGPHPEANTDCSICHLNRDSQEPDIQNVHNDDCRLCHTDRLGSTFLGPLGTWNQECAACHNPTINETSNLKTPTKNHRCILCHEEKNSSVVSMHKKHTDKANCIVCHGFIPDTGVEIGSGNRDNCALCHGIGAYANAGINTIHKEMTPEGTSCLECHNDTRPPVDVVYGAPVGNSAHVCSICHNDQYPGEFANDMEKLHKKHTDKKIGCGYCHADAILQDDRKPMPEDVDDSRRSLVARSNYNECYFCHEEVENTDMSSVHLKHAAKQGQWCYNCHEGNDLRPIGFIPPVTTPEESCIICHNNEQYTDETPFNIHKKHSSKSKCYACHQTVPLYLIGQRNGRLHRSKTSVLCIYYDHLSDR